MIEVVWLLVIVVACFGLGRRLLRATGAVSVAAREELAWCIPLGLGTIGILLFGLGLAGLLYRGLILALTVAAVAFAVPEIERWLRGVGALLRDLPSTEHEGRPASAPPHRGASRLVVAGLALGVVAAAAALLGALAPPTAGDALCYHLELPKVYLSQHRITYLPDSANSAYPLLMEMLFLWGLALDGGILAQLLHWLLGVQLAGATYCLAAPVVGRPAASIATAVVLLVPGVTNQMTAPLNDLGVALYATLALAALVRGLGIGSEREVSDDSSAMGWIILAGVFLGFALGMKYVALLLVPGLASAWMIARVAGAKRSVAQQLIRAGASLRSAAGRPSLRAATLMTVVALLVGGPWYLRAAVHTGNPVYPFLSSWFGGEDARASGSDKTPLAPTAAGLLASPWQITMRPEGFGGRAAQLGVVFLAVLPGLLWVRPNKPLTVLLIVAAVYYIAWFLLRQNLRFLLPIVPVLATAVAWVLDRGVLAAERPGLRLPRVLRAGVVAVLGLILVFQSLIAVARARETARVAVGLQRPDDFLRRHEPSYAVARFASESLPQSAMILSQDYRGFYFEQRVVRENMYRRRTRYDERVETGDDAVGWLRGRGFTHALLVDAAGPGGVRYDRTLQEVLSPRLADLPCRFQHRFVDSDGVTRTYRLVELRPTRQASRSPRSQALLGNARSRSSDSRR